MDSRLSGEELQSVLWDIFEECINGRTLGHKCPICPEAGALDVEVLEDVKVTLTCKTCGKYFEGRMR
ncbi:MAG: hypothetical protein ACI9WU_000993 [Myxococcota bacterium]|jgi:hypothetical protein